MKAEERRESGAGLGAGIAMGQAMMDALKKGGATSAPENWRPASAVARSAVGRKRSSA